MNFGATRLIMKLPGKTYYMVRCITNEPYPWHQCIKYFEKRATDEQVQSVLASFISEVNDES